MDKPRTTPPPLPQPVRALPVETIQYRSGNRVRPNLYQQCAKASWMAPIIVLILGYSSTASQSGAGGARWDTQARIIIGLVNLALVMLGVSLGGFALTGIRTHGRGGILVPALIGVCGNLLLLLVLLGALVVLL